MTGSPVEAQSRLSAPQPLFVSLLERLNGIDRERLTRGLSEPNGRLVAAAAYEALWRLLARVFAGADAPADESDPRSSFDRFLVQILSSAEGLATTDTSWLALALELQDAIRKSNVERGPLTATESLDENGQLDWGLRDALGAKPSKQPHECALELGLVELARYLEDPTRATVVVRLLSLLVLAAWQISEITESQNFDWSDSAFDPLSGYDVREFAARAGFSKPRQWLVALWRLSLEADATGFEGRASPQSGRVLQQVPWDEDPESDAPKSPFFAHVRRANPRGEITGANLRKLEEPFLRAPPAEIPIDARDDATDDSVEFSAADDAPDKAAELHFSVYRPRSLRPKRWATLLAFAHRAQLPPNAPPDALDPLEVVERQAASILGSQISEYHKVAEDSSRPVPFEARLDFVPDVPGIEFDPPTASVRWRGEVHRAEFQVRAPLELAGQVIPGELRVMFGSVLVAEIPLSLNVLTGNAPRELGHVSETVRMYRKIFASYSHKDRHVVEEFREFAKAFGDQYLIDVEHLRAGERWSDQLKTLIAEADLFQLFWSWNSQRSPYVRQEWEYAVSLGRPKFVRATYWEKPMPAAEQLPTALRAFHFQHVRRLATPETPSPTAVAVPVEELSDVLSPASYSVDDSVRPPPTHRKRTAALTIGSVVASALLVLLVNLRQPLPMNLPVTVPTELPPPKEGRVPPIDPPPTLPSVEVPTKVQPPDHPRSRPQTEVMDPWDDAPAPTRAPTTSKSSPEQRRSELQSRKRTLKLLTRQLNELARDPSLETSLRAKDLRKAITRETVRIAELERTPVPPRAKNRNPLLDDFR